MNYLQILIEFSIIAMIQLLSILIAAGITILLAIIYDAANRSMSWFTHQWLLFGLYVCPLIIGLALGPAGYVIYKRCSYNKLINRHEMLEDGNQIISLSYQIQLFLHAHCGILVLMVLLLTALDVRSVFCVMLTIMFYCFTTFINYFGKIQEKGLLWILPHLLGQIFPYIQYSYMTISVLKSFVPIQGRSGPAMNPDIIIAGIAVLLGILMFGFIVPIFCLVKKPLRMILGFVVVFVIFIIIMATPVGFPYREAVSAQRFWIFVRIY